MEKRKILSDEVGQNIWMNGCREKNLRGFRDSFPYIRKGKALR